MIMTKQARKQTSNWSDNQYAIMCVCAWACMHACVTGVNKKCSALPLTVENVILQIFITIIIINYHY